MPKKTSGKKKSGKGVRKIPKSLPAVYSRMSVVPFRQIFILSATAGAVTPVVSRQSLNIASLGDRIVDIGDTFTYFRVSRLHVYASCSVATAGVTFGGNEATAYVALGFTPNYSGNFTAPTTLSQVIDFPEFQYTNGYGRAVINVGPSGLYNSSPLKWYQCGTTSTDPAFTSAGTLVIITANSSALASYNSMATVIVEGIIEFKDPIDSALIPLDKLKARVAREEKRIGDLSLLRPPEPDSPYEEVDEKDVRVEHGYDLNNIDCKDLLSKGIKGYPLIPRVPPSPSTIIRRRKNAPNEGFMRSNELKKVEFSPLPSNK